MLKLIVIYVVSDVISEIIISFDLVLKIIVNINMVRIYNLIYHSFILIINYYRLKESVNLSEKRVYNNSLKVHDMKY